jgi:hypothetical protein
MTARLGSERQAPNAAVLARLKLEALARFASRPASKILPKIRIYAMLILIRTEGNKRK